MALGMRIAHILPMVGRRSLGLGPVAINLAKQQRKLGCEAEIWCTDSEEEVRSAVVDNCMPEGVIARYEAFEFSRVYFSPSMERAVGRDVGGAIDVVHQHGVLTALSRVTNRWRETHKGCTVIAPHGCLDGVGLNRSWWKKKIAIMAYEGENLHRASCLHATSMLEVESLRTFGLRNPVALIPNGLSEEWLEGTGDGSRFLEDFGLQEGRPVMLYLGRVTPLKGLPMLVRALARMRCELDNWLLVIAGPDEFNHAAAIVDLIKELKMERWVRIVGPLYSQQKRDAFAAASLFVLPSYSEAFSLVVTEALGAGVPVLTTKGVPWPELETQNCGWWTEATEDGLLDTLRRIMDLPEAALGKMGRSGKELVIRSYLWSQAAQKTCLLYQWLLGGGSRPEFVIPTESALRQRQRNFPESNQKWGTRNKLLRKGQQNNKNVHR
jgi:glycosyltransferase involved in cell wall biosynthesis